MYSGEYTSVVFGPAASHLVAVHSHRHEGHANRLLGYTEPRRFASRMLIKSLISPTQPRRVETHLSPRSVLTSLRGSTIRTEHLGCQNHFQVISVRKDPCKGRTAHTKRGLYLLGPSLAPALPVKRRVLARRGWVGERSGLFEHPARRSQTVLAASGSGW